MSNIQKQHKISPAIAWLTIQKFIIFYCPLDGEHTILCATRWDFLFVDYFMHQYPKQSLTIEQQMQPIFDKILSLSKEILISEQARDRILSKLMSGELEVLE